MVRASKDSQIWITTHSTDLSDYILDLSGHTPLVIEKVAGETRLVGVKLGEHPDNQDDDDEDAGNVPNDNMAGSGSNRGKSNKSAEVKKQIKNMNQKKADAEQPDPEAAAAAEKLASLRKKLEDKST